MRGVFQGTRKEQKGKAFTRAVKNFAQITLKSQKAIWSSSNPVPEGGSRRFFGGRKKKKKETGFSFARKNGRSVFRVGRVGQGKKKKVLCKCSTRGILTQQSLTAAEKERSFSEHEKDQEKRFLRSISSLERKGGGKSFALSRRSEGVGEL